MLAGCVRLIMQARGRSVRGARGSEQREIAAGRRKMRTQNAWKDLLESDVIEVEAANGAWGNLYIPLTLQLLLDSARRSARSEWL